MLFSIFLQNQNQQKDKGGNSSVKEEKPHVKKKKGLFDDIGVVEPDDNPLSCLVEEEEAGLSGKERPPRRPLVTPVEPELLVS